MRRTLTAIGVTTLLPLLSLSVLATSGTHADAVAGATCQGRPVTIAGTGSSGVVLMSNLGDGAFATGSVTGQLAGVETYYLDALIWVSLSIDGDDAAETHVLTTLGNVLRADPRQGPVTAHLGGGDDETGPSSVTTTTQRAGPWLV